VKRCVSCPDFDNFYFWEAGQLRKKAQAHLGGEDRSWGGRAALYLVLVQKRLSADPIATGFPGRERLGLHLGPTGRFSPNQPHL